MIIQAVNVVVKNGEVMAFFDASEGAAFASYNAEGAVKVTGGNPALFDYLPKHFAISTESSVQDGSV